MAVFAQLAAVCLALLLEEISQWLEEAQRITNATAHLWTATAISLLLALPTFGVISRIRSVTIKIAMLTGGAFLVFHHVFKGFDPAVLPYLNESVMNYFGVGFLLVAIYAAVVEIGIANDNLRNQENRFSKLVQTAQEAVAILNHLGRFTFVNPKFIETLGLPRHEILGLNLSEFIDPEELPPCLKEFSGASAHFECKLHIPNGKTLVMLGSATVLNDDQDQTRGAFLMLTDVTALKQAESALRESERNYREIFNATNEALIILDLDGRILDVNSRTCELFGVSRNDAMSSTLDDFSSNGTEAAGWVQKATTEGPQLFEWPVRGRNGRAFWTEVSLRSSNVGGRQCVIAALRDISERKQLEAQLRQAQKMEAIGQLAGGIAHDFNNLLQVINGYTELTLEDAPCDPATREALTEIRRASDSATRLVRQLLAFSRRQVLKQESLEINEVVGGVMNMLHRVIGEHIRVVFLPGRHVEPIYADRGQMEQVLMNLSVNARDAMPNGGTLTIETGDAVLDKEFCHANNWAREGQYVLLSVSDNGCGMDPKTLSRIWEPFFTTKEVGKGTGLGLATVYGIVRQHDGMVHVYSEFGKGTVFKIYLPALKNPMPLQSKKTDADTLGGRETVLLAEDNEMVRNLTRNMLEQAGYTVLTARDGVEAVQLFEERGDTVDLALMDLVMPGMGGDAVYTQVRSRFPKVRFLFASGYSSGVVQNAVTLGDNFELIQKPFDRKDLLLRLRKLIDIT
jgi:PAS domain S-box-containing protein